MFSVVDEIRNGEDGFQEVWSGDDWIRVLSEDELRVVTLEREVVEARFREFERRRNT